MISPENLSIDALYSIFSNAGGISVEKYKGVLKVRSQDSECLVSVVQNEQVRFFMPSRATSEQNFSRGDLLEVANGLNNDLTYKSWACVTEDKDIVFHQSIPVDAELSEHTFVIALLSFISECILRDIDISVSMRDTEIQ